MGVEAAKVQTSDSLKYSIDEANRTLMQFSIVVLGASGLVSSIIVVLEQQFRGGSRIIEEAWSSEDRALTDSCISYWHVLVAMKRICNHPTSLTVFKIPNH